MMKVLWICALAGLFCCGSYAQQHLIPDTVHVQSGTLRLTGWLWHPDGPGPFPAVVFSHGNYDTIDRFGSLDSIIGIRAEVSLLGRLFARNGYIFFCLFRRGTGPSAGEGQNSQDLLQQAWTQSLEQRNLLQVRLLETDQLQDMIAGVTFLSGRPDVDTTRLSVLGHSFGGALALVLAAHDGRLKAVVDFGGGAKSWPLSFPLRTLLANAVSHISVPVFFIHAQNDYSTAPAESLGTIMTGLKKPHLVKIYPAFGRTTDAGHNFIFFNVDAWGEDVLRFMAQSFRR